MSIKKMERGAWMLVDKEFNIPLFNAEKQMYKCTNVDELSDNHLIKEYNICFSEIKEYGYNVPERLNVRISIPNTGNDISLKLIEVDDKHDGIELTNKITDKASISSLGNIKKLLYNIGKYM